MMDQDIHVGATPPSMKTTVFRRDTFMKRWTVGVFRREMPRGVGAAGWQGKPISGGLAYLLYLAQRATRAPAFGFH